MPQNKDTGAAGNEYGRRCGERIVKLLGATKVRSGQSSNECQLNGKRMVIKCAGKRKLQEVGVYCEMLGRLDAVIGAFENPDGSYHLYELTAPKYEANMRRREYGDYAIGFVKRAVFEQAGTLLQAIDQI